MNLTSFSFSTYFPIFIELDIQQQLHLFFFFILYKSLLFLTWMFCQT
jgi:hypothetical protein